MFMHSRTVGMKTMNILKPSITRSFQTTAKRALTIPFLPVLPQKPGGVMGTPNDPYKAPPANKLEGSAHWWMEKTFAVTSLPIVTTAILTSGPLSTISDSILSVALLGYCYMEFDSCICDYVQKRVYGKWHDYALYLLGTGSVISLYGIYKLETENDGITGLAKQMWTTTTTKTPEEKVKEVIT